LGEEPTVQEPGQPFPLRSITEDLPPDPGALHTQIQLSFRKDLGQLLPKEAVHLHPQVFKIAQLAVWPPHHLFGSQAAVGKSGENKVAQGRQETQSPQTDPDHVGGRA
jgi:hypothetical protein